MNKINHIGNKLVLLRNLQYHSQLIISGVTIVYIGKNSNAWDMNSNLPSGFDYI